MASTRKTPARGKAAPAVQFSEQKQTEPAADMTANPPATSRRTTKPQDMYRIAIRIPRTMDERLTAANKKTGLGPQPIGHQAINDYATAVGVPEEVPIPAKEDRPFRERTPKKRTYDGEASDNPQFSIRITPLTDTRLAMACDIVGQGPQDLITTALNVWLHKHKIPHHSD